MRRRRTTPITAVMPPITDAEAIAELRARSCQGCVDALPTRACAVSGAPVHRGPEFSFECRAVQQ